MNGATREINRIVVHCSATPCDSKVSYIQKYWKNVLGWTHPGYHKIIDHKGKVTRLLPDDMISNGVRGHNSDSLHICYIGGINNAGKAMDNRTAAQKESLEVEIRKWKYIYGDIEVLGHRDLSPDLDGDGEIQPDEFIKECPSFDAKKEYANL